ncbi:MAG TPA: ATP-binding protein, partial [Bacillota bacterium]|nr:ATP-binding protein [Bacillota bacterium]
QKDDSSDFHRIEVLGVHQLTQGLGIGDHDRLARRIQHGGHGLGLSIAKWIVESHDGKIEVQSAVGKGTRISIHLPCRK